MNEGSTEVLTFAQLAERLGIEVASAKARARRGSWRRVPGNDGKTLVHVPVEALNEPRAEKHEAAPESVHVQLVELERRHRAQVEEVKAEGAAALAQARQDHQAELARIAQLHQAEMERMMNIVTKLSERPSWLARIFGSKW